MTRKHHHQLTREMLESLLEEFARDVYRAHGGTEGWEATVRRWDGRALITLLDNSSRAAMNDPVLRQHVTWVNVRDLISAEEALALFEAALTRARGAEK